MSKPRDIQKVIMEALAVIRSKAYMGKLGQMTAAMIKLRTRLGQGVAKAGAEKQKLKPLADSTKERRRDRKALLHGETSPNRSNLTFTGQLLDSIKVKSVEANRVVVGPSGHRVNEDLTNEQLAEFVTDAGRPFNNISKVELKRLTDQIKRDLRTEIKRRLTTNK